MRYETDAPVSRIHPDRRWFGNTKIISQKQLQLFRAEMSKSLRDPFQLVLKSKKLPYGLLNVDDKQRNRMKLLQVESYENTFGPKMQRKKPKLKTNSLQSFAERAVTQHDNYDSTLDTDKEIVYDRDDVAGYIRGDDIERIFLSGQSQRIKSELYRVIDSSDVLLQVLDARDPMGTRSPHVEKYLSTNCQHKHLVLVLNKIDLVPTWCTKRWLKILSKQYPTIAFKANNMNNTKKTAVSFGKGALISLLRQFRSLFKSQKRTLSVGLFGYPNVGKSSLINCLVGKKACSVAPIPGQTKVWQYVSLFDRFYLIDCPGVVYPRAGDNVVSAILRSVVRIQGIEHPEEYVTEIVSRVRREYLQKMYNVESWTDAFDFMQQIANRQGKLLKGGEPDYHNVATHILYDWQRGKLPWFVSPPFEDDLQYEYKLRNEQRRIEEELRAFTEDQQIEYEAIDVQQQKKQQQQAERERERKENNLKEMDERANAFKLAHEFETHDLDEHAYRQSVRDGADKQQQSAVDELKQIRDEIENMTSTDKTRFEAIEVSNPLDLPLNDPLIVTAKWRQWSKMNKN